MSMRVDSSIIPGALVVGVAGLGVQGQEVPSTGEDGPGYIYDQLSLPADNTVEVYGLITAQPSAGTLFAYEDSGFEFSGAPDGTYTFDWTLYKDGVSSGSFTETLIVGATATTVNATLATVNVTTLPTSILQTTIVSATLATVDVSPLPASVVQKTVVGVSLTSIDIEPNFVNVVAFSPTQDCYAWLESEIVDVSYVTSLIPPVEEYAVSIIDPTGLYLSSTISDDDLFLESEVCVCR